MMSSDAGLQPRGTERDPERFAGGRGLLGALLGYLFALLGGLSVFLLLGVVL